MNEHFLSKRDRIEPGGPSRHLSWRELRCGDGTPYPVEWCEDRALLLAAAFELVRSVWDKPIRITSAYRHPAYNRMIGGKDSSQHVRGRALDIIPPDGVPLAEFQQEILDIAHTPGCIIRGFGKYPWGVHIDVRPTLQIASWSSDIPPRESR